MSRVLLRSLVLALLLMSTLVPAGRASANSGRDIKGVGGGWIGLPPGSSAKDIQFSFSAHTGPNGDFGQAQFSITDEFGSSFDGWVNIDCVDVFQISLVRGGAWFSGLFTKVNDPTGTHFVSPGDRIYFSIFDGGDPNGTTPVDDFEAWYFPPGQFVGVSCKGLVPFEELPDVTHGNIVVSAP